MLEEVCSQHWASSPATGQASGGDLVFSLGYSQHHKLLLACTLTLILVTDMGLPADCIAAPLQVGMSLVLSFFFVWDTPSIAAGMRTLRASRFRAIYNEVAPTFAVFGRLFGKALQAQVGCCPASLGGLLCCAC